jgi:hypothetical protein
MIVVALLPQVLMRSLTVVVARELLETSHEPPQVCELVAPRNDEVQVVGHETVRENCEVELFRALQKAREHRFDNLRIAEQGLAKFRANRQ